MGRNYSEPEIVLTPFWSTPELRSSRLLVHDGMNITFVLTLGFEEQVLT